MSYQGHQDQRWGHISYAQHGDDLFLINLFELLDIKKPSYLDIGAHHPFTISNTALLYERGSRGTNVEANPNLYQAFVKHRPEDVNVNKGVATERGRMQFFMFDETCGRNTFSVSERDQIVAEGHPVHRTMTIDVVPLNVIVDEYCGGRFPHLLSMDIEGLDYAVLESTDFNHSMPEVICVETRRHQGEQMKTMLALKGYVCAMRLAENLIFVKTCRYGRLY